MKPGNSAGEKPARMPPWLAHGKRPWTVRARAHHEESRITSGWTEEREDGFATLAEALDAVVDLAGLVAQRRTATNCGSVELWRYSDRVLSVPLWRHGLEAEEAIARLEVICEAAEALFEQVDRSGAFVRTTGACPFEPTDREYEILFARDGVVAAGRGRRVTRRERFAAEAWSGH